MSDQPTTPSQHLAEFESLRSRLANLSPHYALLAHHWGGGTG